MTAPVHVVTAVIRHRGRVLLLRRSARVGSYSGCWAAVSGYLEGEQPLEQALREVGEETGIAASALRLVRAGRPFEVADAGLGRVWCVHPFLFEADAAPDVKLDWEHEDYRWVRPSDIEGLRTVPRLADALRACGALRGTGTRQPGE